MNKVILVFLLFIFLISADARVSPGDVAKGHPSYAQLVRLMETSESEEVHKYKLKKSMNKAEMAGALSRILIEHSYIDLENEESKRKPLFWGLKDYLSELESLCDFLSSELTRYFQLDVFYLRKEIDNVREYGGLPSKSENSLENLDRAEEIMERIKQRRDSLPTVAVDEIDPEMEKELASLVAERRMNIADADEEEGAVQEEKSDHETEAQDILPDVQSDSEASLSDKTGTEMLAGEQAEKEADDESDPELKKIRELEKQLAQLKKNRDEKLATGEGLFSGAGIEEKNTSSEKDNDLKENDDKKEEKNEIWLFSNEAEKIKKQNGDKPYSFNDEVDGFEKALEDYGDDLIVESIWKTEVKKRLKESKEETSESKPEKPDDQGKQKEPVKEKPSNESIQTEPEKPSKNEIDQVRDMIGKESIKKEVTIEDKIKLRMDKIRESMNKKIIAEMESGKNRKKIRNKADKGLIMNLEDLLDKVEKDMEEIEEKMEGEEQQQDRIKTFADDRKNLDPKSLEDELLDRFELEDNTSQKTKEPEAVNQQPAKTEHIKTKEGYTYNLDEFISDVELSLGRIDGKIAKYKFYRPGWAPRLIDVYNSCVQQEKWVLDARAAFCTNDGFNTDEVNTVDHLGLVYSPWDKANIYMYGDFLGQRSTGLYTHDESLLLGGKITLNNHELHPFRFSAGAQGRLMCDNDENRRGEIYLASSYHPPNYMGIQFLNNLSYVRRNNRNRVLTSWGMEARLWELPAYLMLEMREKFEKNDVLNYGLRFYTGSLVYDITVEDDRKYDQERYGFNMIYRY